MITWNSIKYLYQEQLITNPTLTIVCKELAELTSFEKFRENLIRVCNISKTENFNMSNSMELIDSDILTPSLSRQEDEEELTADEVCVNGEQPR